MKNLKRQDRNGVRQASEIERKYKLGQIDYTKEEIEALKKQIITDNALSTTSTNPVQNKVITHNLNNKVNKETGKGLSTNDYTDDDRAKLAELNNYTLPIASYNTLGGIKVGTGLTINNGILSANGGIADIKEKCLFVVNTLDGLSLVANTNIELRGTVLYDPLNKALGNGYEIPYNGLYRLSSKLRFADNDSGIQHDVGTRFLLNGEVITGAETYDTQIGRIRLINEHYMELTEGDIVTFTAFLTGIASQNTKTGQWSVELIKLH